jgi:hypothetical protein
MPLASLIRVVGTLQPKDSETEEAIRRLLGIREPDATVRGNANEDGPGPSPPRIMPPPDDYEPLDTGDISKTPAQAEQPLDLEVRELPPRARASRPFPNAVSLPKDPAPTARAPLPPLLSPHNTRAVLSTALSGQASDGALDLERLVERVARRLPLSSLPRKPRPTLGRGVHVLVDVSRGMDPFARDARELVARIRLVAGAELTQVYYFEQAPSSVAPEHSPSDFQPYRPPREGASVLVITDLGIAPVAAEADDDVEAAWRKLAATLRQGDSTLIALVPYPEKRWPTSHARELVRIPWDRTTGVTTVRRALRRRSR